MPTDDEPEIVAVPVVAPEGYGFVQVPLLVNATSVAVANVCVVALDVVTVGVVVVSDPEPTVAVGAPATVIELDAAEYGPSPIAFLARTRKMYEVPLVRPVTVADVDIETPSENVVQLDPLFEEY